MKPLYARPTRPDPPANPAQNLGEWLNTVEQSVCPQCRSHGSKEIYVEAVRWVPCWHTTELPPLAKRRGR